MDFQVGIHSRCFSWMLWNLHICICSTDILYVEFLVVVNVNTLVTYYRLYVYFLLRSLSMSIVIACKDLRLSTMGSYVHAVYRKVIFWDTDSRFPLRTWFFAFKAVHHIPASPKPYFKCTGAAVITLALRLYDAYHVRTCPNPQDLAFLVPYIRCAHVLTA